MGSAWILSLPIWEAAQYGLKQYRAYLRRARILDTIQDAISSSPKLNRAERQRVSQDFKNNSRLRDAVMQVKNEREIIEGLILHSNTYLPYEKIARDIAKIYTAQQLEFHPDYVQTQGYHVLTQEFRSNEKIDQLLRLLQDNLPSLEVHERYRTYANAAITRTQIDPLGASADFVTETLRSQGVERFSVGVETGEIEVQYKPSEMNIRARGQTARKLQQMIEDNEAGRLFHCVLDDSDDFTVLFKEYGPQLTIDDSRPARLEFYTAPTVLTRQMQFMTQDVTFTAALKITHDEVHGLASFEPDVTDKNINFRITHEVHAKSATFDVDMKLAEERPSMSSLPLLRLFAALTPDNKLRMFDVEMDVAVGHFELSQVSEPANLLEIAQYAAFVRDFLEADHWLKVKGIAEESLDWPIQMANDEDTAGLLRRIVRTLKDDDGVGFVRAAMMFGDINDAVKDIKVKKGVLEGQLVKVTAPVIINQKHICDQQTIFKEPELVLSRGGELIECERLGDVFPSPLSPIKMQVSHDQAIFSFHKRKIKVD